MASPFFFVKKKDGKLRPMQDYRKLNDLTIKNHYLLPLIRKSINKLSGAKIFTKMDVCWGYNNIRIKEGDEWKATFHTNQGLFKPTVMFFGLTNSPATFQSFMNHIFHNLIMQGHVAVYMDNILFTNDHKQHAQIVKQVLQILRDNDLFLKLEKCVFHIPEVKYLGVIIGHNQVRMDPTKTSVIHDWPIPMSYSGMVSIVFTWNFKFYSAFYKFYNYKQVILYSQTHQKKLARIDKVDERF